MKIIKKVEFKDKPISFWVVALGLTVAWIGELLLFPNSGIIIMLYFIWVTLFAGLRKLSHKY